MRERSAGTDVRERSAGIDVRKRVDGADSSRRVVACRRYDSTLCLRPSTTLESLPSGAIWTDIYQ